MRILQVVSSVEIEAAGPSYTVPSLGRSLAACGHNVVQMSVGCNSASDSGNFHDRRFPPDSSGAWLRDRLLPSSSLKSAIDAESRSADIVHGHGLWRLPNIYCALAARRAGKPFILTPRGMLGPDALRFSRFSKKAFWLLAQGSAARAAQCIHATSEQEYEEIRAFGLRQPVAVIPNGVDLPPLQAERSISGARPYVLSLGRIHPKKGLDRLISAWAMLEAEFPDWELKIVGADEDGHARQLQALVTKLGLFNVAISGPVFGEAKQTMLREAEIFALPTLNENFAMTVAESLAAQTPVISSKGAPWQDLERYGCGWWIDHGADSFASGLRTAMSLPTQERLSMGERGAAWMERDFSWGAVARDMSAVYQWQTGSGPPPGTVRFD